MREDEPGRGDISLMIGARGRNEVREFQVDHFVSQLPPDIEVVTISRTIGQGQVVDEIVSEIAQLTQFLFESRPFRQYRGWRGVLSTDLGTALGVKLAGPGAVP
jgi:hypothetical protein